MVFLRSKIIRHKLKWCAEITSGGSLYEVFKIVCGFKLAIDITGKLGNEFS